MEKNQITLIHPTTAKAFISCSLREEDKWFNDYVEDILRQNGVEPVGTVGKHSASPESIAESMRKQIPLADIVVIIATPRYVRRDVTTGVVSYGLSDMVHVEAGIAYASGKPIVVFAQRGTDVGSFLPGVTQYIELEGRPNELVSKLELIRSLLGNALDFIKNFKAEQDLNFWKRVAIGAAAIYGTYHLIKTLVKSIRK